MALFLQTSTNLPLLHAEMAEGLFSSPAWKRRPTKAILYKLFPSSKSAGRINFHLGLCFIFIEEKEIPFKIKRNF